MQFNHIRYIDTQDNGVVAEFHDDPAVPEERHWDSNCPCAGEQCYFPGYGLYEVQKVIMVFDQNDPHILVKLSYIRKNI